LRLSHETEKLDKGEKIKLTGLVKLPRREKAEIIFEEIYDKDSKSKVRAFYKKFLQIVENFIFEIDNKGEAKENALTKDLNLVLKGLKDHAFKLNEKES
jgi:hypothetical protein